MPDTTPFEQDFGFKLSTQLREGLRRFEEWYGWHYEEKKMNRNLTNKLLLLSAKS